ncbi:penicillin-binding protein 2 [Kistimonas asteriae]|uniref:penicillin-binding protein 2 n=1 Tax=Kistimonas asteriae TaxID=517724 RepID=UPI001BA4AB46|nr:penicillin-binding protein 2 [Kistimonas asteriae]
MAPDTFKDHYSERRLVNFRLWLSVLVMLIMTGGMLARMFYLQVMNYSDLATQSEENRIHLQAVPPIRGLIYDTKGRLLAENQPSYTLTIVRERVKDLEATLQAVGEILPLSDNELDKFRQRLRQRRPFEGVPLKYRLSEEDIARIAVDQFRLPGVEVEAQLIRHYPYNQAFAHAIGYVGRINDRELAALDPALYSGTHVIGKTGVEKYYESVLLGKPGYQEVETNARGRILRVLKRVDPEPGKDLQLYLDLDLQVAAGKALAGKRGSVVAIDPNTGGVLALVSTPAFDPNPFVTGIDYKSYSELRDSIHRPLYNRATLGEYPPASTIKPFMGLAALDSKAVDRRFKVNDPGYFQLPGDDHKYRNWKRQGHGIVDLHRSIVESNDTYFYTVAVKMGIDTIHDYMVRFGFGDRTGLDIASERPGLMPSPEWKRRARGRPWYPGETVISGIGQGYMLTTPLQLAAATSVIANRGLVHRPRLAKPGPDELVPEPDVIQDRSAKEWDAIIDAMTDVVASPRGTAYWRIGRHLKYSMAGKTGTAQVVGIAQGEKYDAAQLEEFQRDHGLFIGFAPVENPQIAVAVVVENDSSLASTIAKKVMDAYLLPRQGKQAGKSSAKLAVKEGNG